MRSPRSASCCARWTCGLGGNAGRDALPDRDGPVPGGGQGRGIRVHRGEGQPAGPVRPAGRIAVGWRAGQPRDARPGTWPGGDPHHPGAARAACARRSRTGPPAACGDGRARPPSAAARRRPRRPAPASPRPRSPRCRSPASLPIPWKTARRSPSVSACFSQLRHYGRGRRAPSSPRARPGHFPA